MSRLLQVGVTLALCGAALIASRAAAQETGRISVGGRERSYLIDLPSNHAARGRLPLVLDFHGGGGSPDYARTQSRFSEVATRGGAIVVYPAGSGRFRNRLLTWNAITCCGYAEERNVDDIAFVRSLIDSLQARYPVDPNRIFVTGHSNGAMLAHLIACNISDRVAAIAVVAGSLNTECKPKRPVSVLMIHGTADANVPIAGGIGTSSVEQHEVKPLSYSVDTWRARNRCTTPAVVTTTGEVTRSVSAECAEGTVVELYTIEGGGHGWPGGQRTRVRNAPSTALDATTVAWEFFRAHPRRDGAR